MLPLSIEKLLPYYFEEDDLLRHDNYWQSLPDLSVKAQIHFKSPGTICAGLPYFVAVFNYLLPAHAQLSSKTLTLPPGFMELEGKETTHLSAPPTLTLPFNVALTGERMALNLLQRASSIATFTAKFVAKVKDSGKKIAILETRKTTPGLRSLEKYAVHIGGGANHRFGQTDLFMIKDNHKNCLGGMKGAYQFFQKLNSFYTPMIAEIHTLSELEEAIALKIPHIMLDRFSLSTIKEAIKIKPPFMTYEISGGVRFENIDDYLLNGIDAISIGALTYEAPAVDISFKFHPIKG